LCFCGAPLYATDKWLSRHRGYICRHKLKSTGLCDRPPIRAELLELHVVNHLRSFIGSVEDWIADLLKERDSERNVRLGQLDREKAALGALERQRDRRMAELEAVGITKVGLEVIERMDVKLDAQAKRITEAEAVLAEWTPAAGVDEALDFYSELVDAIQGRIGRADGPRALHEALASVLAGLWCEIRNGRLRVEFTLKEPAGAGHGPQAYWVNRPDRLLLPSARLPSGQKTKVPACPDRTPGSIPGPERPGAG
jgi:hypothetical protein